MLADFFIGFINYILTFISNLMNFIIGILPNSPFILDNIHEPVNDYLKYLNWIIPIDKIIIVSGFWLIAIGLYYLVSYILRFVKLVS